MQDGDSGRAEDGKIKIQDPDETIKPRFPKTIVPEVVERLYGLKVTAIKELPSYDDINFQVHVSEIWDNNNIKAVRKDGYVLKVLNHLQSSQPVIIEAQNALCSHVGERGIPTQVPLVNKEGKVWSLETFTDTESGKQYGPYLTRLVTYIPGTIFANTPYIPASFYNIGKFVGQLRQAMRGFHHSFFDDYTHIWSLTKVSAMKDFVKAVKNSDDLRVVEEVIAAYESQVVPKYVNFTKGHDNMGKLQLSDPIVSCLGMIHGDLNEQNLIMMECPNQDSLPADQRVHDVAALLDFSDVTKSYAIMDIAISISYMSIDCPDEGQLDVGGHILAGYLKYCDLNESEFQSLRIIVCARLCQSLVYGAHSYAQQPENTYLLTTSKGGWPLLHKLWTIGDDVLFSRWREIIKGYE